jgi:CRISPR-associated exonuclease Cas4
MWIFVAIILLCAGLLVLWLSSRQQRAAGLPGGRVVYADTGGWGPVEQPLYDSQLGLTGKPDYLVARGEQVIPVEVKTGRIPGEPYDTHIYQLAAYCLLVARQYGRRPAYGLIHYTTRPGSGQPARSRTFAIDFTPALEAALLDLLAELRADDHRKEVGRSHSSAARCNGCGYRSSCDQRLKA